MVQAPKKITEKRLEWFIRMLHADIHDPGVVREPNRIQCHLVVLVSNQWRLALP